MKAFNWFALGFAVILAGLIISLACGCSSSNGTSMASRQNAIRSAVLASGSGFPPRPVIAPNRLTNAPPPPPPPAAFTITASSPCGLQTSTDLNSWSDLGQVDNSLVYSNGFETVRSFRGKELLTLTWVNQTTYPVLVTQWSDSWAKSRSYAVPAGTNSLTVAAMASTNRFVAQTFSGTLGAGTTYSGMTPEVDYFGHPPSLSITFNNQP